MSEVEEEYYSPATSELKKTVANGSTTHPEGEREEPDLPTNGHTEHLHEHLDEQGVDDGEESDEYDFEEEQQAVEGEDDEYVDPEDEEGDGEVDQQNGHQSTSLTALLLGDPHAPGTEAADEDHYAQDEGDDFEDDDAEDEDDEYVEPITPTTSKKRTIDEALEETASPREENEAKKIKA